MDIFLNQVYLKNIKKNYTAVILNIFNGFEIRFANFNLEFILFDVIFSILIYFFK